MKNKLLLGLIVLVGCYGMTAAQSTDDVAQLKFNQRSYEGSVSANLSITPFKIGASTLHGIRFDNTEAVDIPSFFIGLTLGWQPWTDGQIIYYAVQPRIYFPTYNTNEYYFAMDIGCNSGITTLKSGKTYIDYKFYFNPMLGAMIPLSERIDLDLSLRVQFLERAFSEGGTQIPIVALSAGIRF